MRCQARPLLLAQSRRVQAAQSSANVSAGAWLVQVPTCRLAQGVHLLPAGQGEMVSLGLTSLTMGSHR